MKKLINPDFHVYRNRHYRPDMTKISMKFEIGDYVMFRGNHEMEPFFGHIKVKYGNTAIVVMEEYGLVGQTKANEFNRAYTCSYQLLKVVSHD